MLLNYIGFISGLLPVIAAVFNYKNLNSLLKTAAVFYLLSFIVDFASWLTYQKYLPISYNYPLLYASILLSITFYSFFYYRVFYSIQNKQIARYAGTVTMVCVIAFMLVKGVQVYPDWPNTILNVLLIVLSLLFFYQLFNRQEFVHIEEQPVFWINAGVLVYFAFTLFLFMLAAKIKTQNFFDINAAANLVSHVFFTIGLSCKHQKTA